MQQMACLPLDLPVTIPHSLHRLHDILHIAREESLNGVFLGAKTVDISPRFDMVFSYKMTFGV